MMILRKTSTKLVILGLWLAVTGYAADSKPESRPKKSEDLKKSSRASRPLEDKSVEDIAKNYMFVGDFNSKDETRAIGPEVFWRYPVTAPKVGFGLTYIEDYASPEMQANFPVTPGAGRAIEHLNLGRNAFLEGDIETARNTWLGGQARYKSSYPYHRRAQYFISQGFFYKALKLWRERGENFEDTDVKVNFGSSTKFLTRALDERRQSDPDPLIEQTAPRSYYNLAALYYNYKRFAGVMGATSMGLDFLREKGRTEYRREFHLMASEIYIMNHDYLEAVRELDTTMRLHPDLETASHAFSRIGDIYFDLNNFDLAEEVYGIAARIDRKINVIRPLQFAMRGEALFWMGRFEESRQMMQYALDANHFPARIETLMAPQEKPFEIPAPRAVPYAINELDLHMEALASMRIADTYLAQKNFEKAKLAYFQHSTQFKMHETAAYAELRLACLELPEYQGNNIMHARNKIQELLKNRHIIQHNSAVEMATTCEMASYAQHERTPAMVERVRTFAKQYPNSDFLKSLVAPVREVQSRNIEPFFAENDMYGAIDFFEKTRKDLYPNVSDELARKLFVAYVDTNHSEKAEEFLKAYQSTAKSGIETLRLAVAIAEFSDRAADKKLKEFNKTGKELAKALEKQSEKFKSDDDVKLYLVRLMASRQASLHYPWVMKLAMSWGDKDISTACNMVYPLLDRIRKSGVEMSTQSLTETFIQQNLMDMLRFETNCAYSMMEYEVDLYKGRLSQLAKLYEKRTFVPLNSTTSNILWNIAEGCLKEGARENAQQLWKYLVEKGSQDLPEVRFAKARLDGRRTELEDLWQK